MYSTSILNIVNYFDTICLIKVQDYNCTLLLFNSSNFSKCLSDNRFRLGVSICPAVLKRRSTGADDGKVQLNLLNTALTFSYFEREAMLESLSSRYEIHSSWTLFSLVMISSLCSSNSKKLSNEYDACASMLLLETDAQCYY